jgi:hypothetical protein
MDVAGLILLSIPDQISSLAITFPNVMALAMLVAVARERALMQLVAVMQNLLVILLPLASMNTTMRLYPLIVRRLAAISVTRMVRWLFHACPPCRRRLYPPLASSVVIMTLIVRMMIPAPVVLSHRYALAVGV